MQQVRKRKVNANPLIKVFPRGSMLEINSRLQNLTISEHNLLHQIDALNFVLTNAHKKAYKSGFLFDHILSQELCNAMVQFLTKNIIVSQFGFDLPAVSFKCNKKTAVLPPLNPEHNSIQSHIEQSYCNKIIEYKRGGHCFARNHLKPEWSPSLRTKIKTEPSSCCHKMKRNNIDNDKTLKAESLKECHKTAIEHPLEQVEQMKVKLKQLLNRCKVGSVWLPPLGCPQLLGCFTYSVTRGFALRMHRYCFLRHALKSDLFDALLQWAEQLIGIPFSCIEIIASKSAFTSKWGKIGWSLAAWQKEDTYVIRYLRRF